MSRAPHPRATAIAVVLERMAASLGDNFAARQMHSEASRLGAGAQALEKMSRSRSPVETEAAHFKRTAEAAGKFDKEITASLNRAIVAFQHGKEAIQARIDDKLNFKPDDKYAREIRDRYAAMNGKEKNQLLKTLVEEGAGPELAALLKAPSILTGIPDARREHYEQAFAAKHAAAELAEIKRLEGVFATFSTIEVTACGLVKELVDPLRAAEIDRGVAAANAAGDAFNQALSDSTGA